MQEKHTRQNAPPPPVRRGGKGAGKVRWLPFCKVVKNPPMNPPVCRGWRLVSRCHGCLFSAYTRGVDGICIESADASFLRAFSDTH